MFRFKEHMSIALVTALFIGTVWQTFTVVNFYINQEAIIEAHCINKDQPDLNCKGQCHLKKQLEASTPDQEETKTTTSAKTSILLFVFAKTHEDISWDENIRGQKYFPQKLNQTQDYISEVFNPPQYI